MKTQSKIRVYGIIILTICMFSSLAFSAWDKDVKMVMRDYIWDDIGAGYVYPDGYEICSADIVEFEFFYNKEKQEITLSTSVMDPKPYTRLGILLFDEEAFKNASKKDFDYTIGGTEIMAPRWNGHGVNFLFGLPETQQGDYFDYNVKNINPAGQPRPDNAVYTHHADTTWLGMDGQSTEDPDFAYRLQINTSDYAIQYKAESREKRIATQNWRKRKDQRRLPNGEESRKITKISFTIPVNKIFSTDLDPKFLEKTSKLYVILYSYFIHKEKFVEYGAMEIDSELGAPEHVYGLNPQIWNVWYDVDAYDVLFQGEGEEQRKLLLYNQNETHEQAVVKFSEVGKGIVEIKMN